MCPLALAALLGLAAGCDARPASADLLTPLDPRVATQWRPPRSPTAGLRRYAPVEARSDWGVVPPSGGVPGGATPGTAKSGGGQPGMRMPGMDMPGMGGR